MATPATGRPLSGAQYRKAMRANGWHEIAPGHWARSIAPRISGFRLTSHT